MGFWNLFDDFVEFIGPDTPLLDIEKGRKKRNEMCDTETKRSTVTVQIVNFYDGNTYRLIEINIGMRADYAASSIAAELGLRKQSEYELVYFDKDIPVAIDPNEFVRDYWHMSKMFLQVKPVRK